MNIEGRLASLKLSQTDIERLVQENQDLKRQLTGGAFTASSCQISFDELEVDEQVGGGGFAIVHRGLWRGTPVAIKKWFDPNMTDELMQEFREEVTTLQQLRHPNVLQFLGACMKPPNLCMVTEYLPFSLHGVMYNTPNIDLDRKRIVTLAQDVARAFIYLHSRRPPVVHRDLKPANLLLDRSWKVKLCDFGLASQSRANVGAGTPAYMAPELLDGRPYNEKVDVYAFGVVLNEMVSREMPFSSGVTGPADIKAKVLAGQRPEVPLSCPRVLQDIITKCWDQEASARPTFEKVLEMLKDAAKAWGA